MVLGFESWDETPRGVCTLARQDVFFFCSCNCYMLLSTRLRVHGWWMHDGSPKSTEVELPHSTSHAACANPQPPQRTRSMNLARQSTRYLHDMSSLVWIYPDSLTP
jgi:hypothetical protein